NESLLRVMAGASSVCHHLHVPLQSAADGVLARMRRRYDAGLARERLAMIRELLPDAAIGTDLIAGFHGEEDADFERTLGFLDASPLSSFHVFPYSVRSGTTAAKLDGRVLPPTIAARARRLRALGDRKHAEFARRFDGAAAEFLGDAVLALAMSDLLMARFPEASEGELSKIRASLVNADVLARKARELDVGSALRFGKGEEKSGGREKVSILASGYEALLGAVYADAGYEAARAMVENHFAAD